VSGKNSETINEGEGLLILNGFNLAAVRVPKCLGTSRTPERK